MSPVIPFHHASPADARNALTTYWNYNEAWCLESQVDTLRRSQMQLPLVKRLKPSGGYDAELVVPHLKRCLLTLRLIRAVSSEREPDLAAVSALWLPVQVYYSVYALGLAYLSVRTTAPALPDSHSAFIRSVRDIAARFFPSPWSASLAGGYYGFKHLEPEWHGIRLDKTQFGRVSNLGFPTPSTQMTHVARCLSTTRERLVQVRIYRLREDRRKETGNPRSQLNGCLQGEAAARVRATTIFDYLYRMRRKSNYQDPAMYGVAGSDPSAALGFARSCQRLSSLLTSCFVVLIERSIRGHGGDGVSRCVDDLRRHVEQK